MNNKLTKKHNLDWIWFIFITFLGLSLSISSWNDGSRFGIDESVSPWMYLLFLIIFLMFMVGIQRSMGVSWKSVWTFAGYLDPKDEREWHIYRKASQYSFGISYLVTFLMIGAILVFPTPSSQAIFYMLGASFGAQLAVRDFLTWKFGLR